MKRPTLATMAVLISIFLTLGAAPALADIANYTLTGFNQSGYSGPYATVTINRTSSTTADISFDSLTNGGYIYLFTHTSAADLNVNASSFDEGSLTATNSLPNFSPGPASFNSGKNADGYGAFNLNVDLFDSFTHSANKITFTLTNLSGTWGSATDVLIANGNGQVAAAGIGACAMPGCDGNNQSGFATTGFAGDAQVPDGGMTVTLLGGALVGLAALRRRLAA